MPCFMQKIDPEKTLFDLIAFDGAANVQKAGALMEQHFPRCTVIVGIEHTFVLLFGEVIAGRPMQEMCQFAKLVSYVIDVILFLDAMLAIINMYFTFFYSSEMYLDLPDMLPMQCLRKYPRFTTMVGFCSSLNHLNAGWEGRHCNY